MPGHIKTGGVWKALNGLHTKVGATWKEVQAGYIKTGGLWKQFYSAAFFPTTLLLAEDFETSPTDAFASLTFLPDGTVNKQGAVYVDDWVQPTTAGPGTYEIKANSASPGTPTGTMDTWQPLLFDRTWSVTETGIGGTSATFTIEIREGAGPTLVTRSCTVNAEVDT